MSLLAVGCDWWLKEKRDGGLLVLWNRKVSYILYEGDGVLCIYGMWVLQYRKDRWGGWLEFRCKIDWMAAGDLVEIRVKI